MFAIILTGIIIIILLEIALIVGFVSLLSALETYYESMIDNSHEVTKDLMDLEDTLASSINYMSNQLVEYREISKQMQNKQLVSKQEIEGLQKATGKILAILHNNKGDEK